MSSKHKAKDCHLVVLTFACHASGSNFGLAGSLLLLLLGCAVLSGAVMGLVGRALAGGRGAGCPSYSDNLYFGEGHSIYTWKKG